MAGGVQKLQIAQQIPVLKKQVRLRAVEHGGRTGAVFREHGTDLL